MIDDSHGHQLSPEERDEFDRCLANYLAGLASPDERRRLEQWISKSAWAREEYVRQSEAEAMLQWQHGQVKGTEALTANQATPASQTQTGSSRFFWPLLAGCAVAVVIILAKWWNTGAPPQPRPSVGPSSSLQLAQPWNVRSAPGTRYTVLASDQLCLEQGELFVHSSPESHDSPPLNIETPYGNVTSSEGSFYVGTYPQKEKLAMPNLTRVLVIAGAVTLSTLWGTVEGNPNELLAAKPDSRPEVVVVKSNNEFAMDLYRKMSEKDGNLFVSPYSISQALMLAMEGARGETAEEIGRLLHFPEDARHTGADREELPWQTALLHTGTAQIRERMSGEEDAIVQKKRKRIALLKAQIAEVNKRLRKLEDEDEYREARALSRATQAKVREHNELVSQVDQYELRIANAMWVEKSYRLSTEFKNTIDRFYTEGAIFPVDFRNRHAEVRDEINQWAAEQTNNRIQEILRPKSLSRDTSLVLANAVYFRGEWVEPFETHWTKERTFTLADSSQVKVPMMHARYLESCRFADFDGDGKFFDTPRVVPVRGSVQTDGGEQGFSLIELPYKGDEVQMWLIAPNDPANLKNVEALLTTENLAKWNRQMVSREAHVFLPKFELEQKTNLNTILQALGMRQAFVMPTGQDGADFSGVTSAPNSLFIGAVNHKAFLQVSEKGTEAAAVTVIDLADSAVARETVPFTPTFRGDRPFCFLIRNKTTGTILFMGRYTNPEN